MATTNSRQVVVSLSGGEIISFELDQLGQLGELEKKDMSGDVACLNIGPVPEGRQRCRFLAVGTFDGNVSLRSLIEYIFRIVLKSDCSRSSSMVTQGLLRDSLCVELFAWCCFQVWV